MLETHSEDASRLLAACAAERAQVVGFSIGAIIGLDLAIRHPLQVETLIAHEPPLVHVLPEPLRTQARREQDEAVEAHRREGAAAAGKKFMAMTGITYEDSEPGVERPQPNPRTVANSEFFLAHDAPAAHAYRLDVAALKASSARIMLAAGRATAGLWIHQCPRSLAGLLGADTIEFPGGHAGFASHPHALAARLREVLAGAAAA